MDCIGVLSAAASSPQRHEYLFYYELHLMAFPPFINVFKDSKLKLKFRI
jgi:hypothetical protein